MAQDLFFDIASARKELPWLEAEILDLEELGKKGQKAMDEYDLDSADDYTRRIQDILDRINKKGIIMRDFSDVLVDFPAVINDMPSYLCWRPEDGDIMYWHYADQGFAGRKRITGGESIMSYL